MNNYLNEVRKHLSGIPTEDIDDLMYFYEEYFYDAGMTDTEAKARYGKPKKFAQSLKMTYFMDQDDAATTGSRPKSRLYLVWMIILGLFASPILVPLAIAAAAVIFALLIAFLSIVFSAYAIVISFILVGVTSIIAGLAVIFQSFATAMMTIGAGLLILGLGTMLAPLLLKFTRLLFELFMKFVKWLGRKFARHSHVNTSIKNKHSEGGSHS